MIVILDTEAVEKRISRYMKKNWPRRTIVLGGARSGKSSFAERLVESRGKPKVYIATAQAFDAEMKSRVSDHKARRKSAWRTVETPLEAAKALADLPETEIALLDCATLWLSNQMLAERDLDAECAALVDAFDTCAAEVVVVSNEVGSGVVPDTALGRRFRDEQGRLNQLLAAKADLAVLVVAGLPLVLKGNLPEGLR